MLIIIIKDVSIVVYYFQLSSDWQLSKAKKTQLQIKILASWLGEWAVN